jgi:hypothetical protein
LEREKIVKTCLFIFLFLVSCALATDQSRVTSFTITKGTLSFDDDGMRFRVASNTQGSKPISAPKQSLRVGEAAILGLRVISISNRVEVISAGGQPKDVSMLTLLTDDGSQIELTAGQKMEVFRVDITFADNRRLTLWKPASQIK